MKETLLLSGSSLYYRSSDVSIVLLQGDWSGGCKDVGVERLLRR